MSGTCAKGEKMNFRNPPTALVRYQLMEVIVRMARRKYWESKQVEKISDAIKMLLEKIVPVFNKHNIYEEWRKPRFYNEPCDVVLKHYEHVIKTIYDKYKENF